jgi:hypothetical protein
MFSLRITYLLLLFEGGLTKIMVQHRDDEREPAIATFFYFFFANWSLVAGLMVRTMLASPRANAGRSNISDNQRAPVLQRLLNKPSGTGT